MDPRFFFITGLPRSRTSWLSVLFTYGEALCLHEASRDGLSPMEVGQYLRKVGGRRFFHLGTSDSGILLRGEELRGTFPEAQILVVRRPNIEVQESLVNHIGISHQKAEALGQIFTPLVDSFIEAASPVLEIDYKDLDDPGSMRGVWDYLLPGMEFPEYRWEQLKTLRIDLNLPVYNASLSPTEKAGIIELMTEEDTE